MLFMFHITIFLGLIALVSGVYLFIWSSRVENKFYKVCAWLLGLIVSIIAILGLVCVISYSVKLQRAMGMEVMMMEVMDMQKPMMKPMMGSKMMEKQDKKE